MTADDRFAPAAVRLAELRAGFRARLRDRLVELDARLVAARAGDATAHAEALLLAHSLAGTAGSYGYADAGIQAAKIERTLRERLDDDAWRVITAALAAAQRAT